MGARPASRDAIAWRAVPMETTYMWEPENDGTRMSLSQGRTERIFCVACAHDVADDRKRNRKDLALLKRRLESQSAT